MIPASGGADIPYPLRDLNVWELLMSNLIARFSADESGATAIEYALLAALIAVGIIGAAGTLGNNLSKLMGNVANSLAS